MARRRNVFLVVDGAHGPGHLPLTLNAYGCDAYAGSLHKWFSAPRGTGVLYVRRERIADVWPLFAPYDKPAKTGITKFEEVGTVTRAGPAVLPMAVDAYEAIGPENKAARLRYLRERWTSPLLTYERVRFFTNFDAGYSCSLVGFTVDGTDRRDVRRSLRERGFAIGTFHEPELPQFSGLTVGANITNSVDDLDRFVEAIVQIAKLR